MTICKQRVDGAIAALTETQKADLLDAHIGPVLPGRAPDPGADAQYLRDIVESQLREQDEQEANGLAKLERRIGKLERFIKTNLVGGMAEAIVDCVRRELGNGGYMRHLGTWDPDHAHRKGACVVAEGGTWLAITDTARGTKPGKGLEWRLIARGDAAEARRQLNPKGSAS
jgi:hypothetical protein